MDTSKEYIKMCDCEEIQSKWGVPEDGDFIWDKSYGIEIVNDEIRVEILFERETVKNEYIDHKWLPRQDQIQEMMLPELRRERTFEKEYEMLESEFHTWVSNSDYHTTRANLWSMEQLWLAFYMSEKHDKTWDGGKWEKS